MQKKTGTSRKEKAVQTKSKIYESAKQLFIQYGYENVNVDDIVKHAGVAKGSFYVHFESKNSLISILINDYVEQVDMDYKTYLESLSPDVRADEVLLSIIRKIANVITDDIGHENMNMLYRIQLEKEISDRKSMSYNREIYKMFYDIIHKGIEQKIFRTELSEEEIAKQFMMIYRGVTYEWCVRYPEFDLKSQTLKLFDLLITGIKS